MPELPEVETVRRQLEPELVGTTITALAILDPRWSAPLAPAEVADIAVGRRVQALRRRGKYLDWVLDGEIHLLMHLRMTGTLLLDPPGDLAHTRVEVTLDGTRRLRFVDPRRFGTGQIVVGDEALATFFASRLGVEPFDDAFTPALLRALARGRRGPIKSFLLDQHRIAGIGNIYADEALFRTAVHPLLSAGIDARGASIDDFRHLDGARGSFQDRFLVHRRAGEPCPVCGTTVRKLVVGGRGTYVCVARHPVARI